MEGGGRCARSAIRPRHARTRTLVSEVVRDRERSEPDRRGREEDRPSATRRRMDDQRVRQCRPRMPHRHGGAGVDRRLRAARGDAPRPGVLRRVALPAESL